MTDPCNTDQQRAFVRYVVEGMSYRDAAEEAGYRPDYGHELAGKEHIQKAIQELREEVREESIVDAATVAEGLLREARHGHDEGEEDASHSARVRAWELLGEHLGMFDETRGEDGAPDQVNIYQQINERLSKDEESASR